MRDTEYRKKQVAYFSSVIVLLAVVAFAYLQPYKAGSDLFDLYDYTEEVGSQFIDITINDYILTVDTMNNNAVYETLWLTTEQTTEIQVGDFSNSRIYVNGVEVFPNSKIGVSLTELKNDKYIEFKYYDELHGFETSFFVRTFPKLIPDFYTTSNAGGSESTYCFALTSHDCIIKMDAHGNILYFRKAVSPQDFRTHLNSEGEKRYSFTEKTNKYVAETSYFPACRAIIMDEAFNVIDVIEKVYPQSSSADYLVEYGFEYIDDGDYCLASLQKEYSTEGIVNNNGVRNYRILNNVIQRIKNNNPIWTVKLPINIESFDFKDSDEYIDLFHLNDMKLSPDLSLINCVLSSSRIIVSLDVNSGRIVEKIITPDGLTPQCLSTDSSMAVLKEENRGAIYSHSASSGWNEEQELGAEIEQYGSVDSFKGNYVASYGKSSNQTLLATEFGSSGVPIVEIFYHDTTDCEVYIDRIYYARGEFN